MKYYIALAINKKDPTDIFGLCENSFDMSWERNKVNLFTPMNIEEIVYHVPMKKYFKNHIDRKNNTWIENKKLKGRKIYFKKLLSDLNYKKYHPCGRSKNEYEWHWCNHYAIRCSRFFKNKNEYDFRCFRVNSKNCPVIVDLTVREGMNHNKIKFNKYNWRNADFVLKSNDR